MANSHPQAVRLIEVLQRLSHLPTEVGLIANFLLQAERLLPDSRGDPWRFDHRWILKYDTTALSQIGFARKKRNTFDNRIHDYLDRIAKSETHLIRHRHGGGREYTAILRTGEGPVAYLPLRQLAIYGLEGWADARLESSYERSLSNLERSSTNSLPWRTVVRSFKANPATLQALAIELASSLEAEPKLFAQIWSERVRTDFTVSGPPLRFTRSFHVICNPLAIRKLLTVTEEGGRKTILSLLSNSRPANRMKTVKCGATTHTLLELKVGNEVKSVIPIDHLGDTDTDRIFHSLLPGETCYRHVASFPPWYQFLNEVPYEQQ